MVLPNEESIRSFLKCQYVLLFILSLSFLHISKVEKTNFLHIMTTDISIIR